MTDECLHGLDPTTCSICLHGVSPMVAQHPTVEATFQARYDGQCDGCDLPIRIGEVIHRLSDDRYVHQGCEA